MTLSLRLTIAMVALVLFSVLAVGLLTQRNLREAFVPEQMGRMAADAHRLATDLEAYITGAGRDVLALSAHPDLEDVVTRVDEGDAIGERRPANASRRRLAEVFAAEMGAKPQYLQMRLIGLRGEGEEIVRVERSRAGRVQVMPDELLQPKAHRAYFQETIGLPDGTLHVSPIELNREFGVIEQPPVPVVRISTPVTNAEGLPFGIVVVNIDLRAPLARLRSEQVAEGNIHLLNVGADYLLHPDPAREFGFEFGRRENALEDYPDLTPLLSRDDAGFGTIHDSEGRALGAAIAPVSLGGGRDAWLLITTPYEAVLTGTGAVEESMLVVSVVAVIVAVVLAVLLSQWIAAPLTRMARTIEGFDGEGSISLPSRAAGETGVLARAFARFIERGNLLNAAIRSSNCAVLTRGLDGRITSWNRGAEVLFGFSESEALGQSSRIILPDEYREEFDRIGEAAHRNEFPGTVETVRRTKSGDLVDVALTVSPLRSAGGELVGVSVFALDIRERKQAERSLRIAKQTAERASLMKSQFLANMSHELRTPLNSVIGFSEMMLLKVAGPIQPARYADYVEAINAGGKHLLALVDDLLDLSRAESGNLALNETVFALTGLVRDVHEMMVPLAEPGEVELTLGLPGEDLMVRADERKMRQVLLNLVSNAVKFTPPGGRVSITARRLGTGETKLIVEDTGIGIPKDAQAWAFSAYAQVDDAYSSREGSGAGLGLALCKRLVELHGGQIALSSVVSVGTTVTVVLPATRSSDTAVTDPIGMAG